MKDVCVKTEQIYKPGWAPVSQQMYYLLNIFYTSV